MTKSSRSGQKKTEKRPNIQENQPIRATRGGNGRGIDARRSGDPSGDPSSSSSPPSRPSSPSSHRQPLAAVLLLVPLPLTASPLATPQRQRRRRPRSTLPDPAPWPTAEPSFLSTPTQYSLLVSSIDQQAGQAPDCVWTLVYYLLFATRILFLFVALWVVDRRYL